MSEDFHQERVGTSSVRCAVRTAVGPMRLRTVRCVGILRAQPGSEFRHPDRLGHTCLCSTRILGRSVRVERRRQQATATTVVRYDPVVPEHVTNATDVNAVFFRLPAFVTAGPGAVRHALDLDVTGSSLSGLRRDEPHLPALATGVMPTNVSSVGRRRTRDAAALPGVQPASSAGLAQSRRCDVDERTCRRRS